MPLIYIRLFCCNHTCNGVGMISVTSTSRYQSRSSMYIRGLIPRNSTELAEAVPIVLYEQLNNPIPSFKVGTI